MKFVSIVAIVDFPYRKARSAFSDKQTFTIFLVRSSYLENFKLRNDLNGQDDLPTGPCEFRRTRSLP